MLIKSIAAGTLLISVAGTAIAQDAQQTPPSSTQNPSTTYPTQTDPNQPPATTNDPATTTTSPDGTTPTDTPSTTDSTTHEGHEGKDKKKDETTPPQR